jgi:hypothetical protein
VIGTFFVFDSLSFIQMVSTTQAAQAGSMWVSRRVRVASQQLTSSSDHHGTPIVQSPPRFSVGLQPQQPRQWKPESIGSLTESISSKIKEKYVDNLDLMNYHLSLLNGDVFWNRFTSLQDLSRLESKQDILRVISTFQFISKKSIFLFSIYSKKVIASLPLYSAGELAGIMNAFAQLGFLEESFCLQVAQRILGDIHTTSAQELVYIADGFATTRCYHTGVIEAITQHASNLIPHFSVDQVSLLSSSLARLNVRDERSFEALGRRMLQLTDVFQPNHIFTIPEEVAVAELPTADPDIPCSARDVTLTAYAFAKMRIVMDPLLEKKIVDLSKLLVRDFTAKELQMLTTAFDRWRLDDPVLYGAISTQAQRRIAQFSSESLVLLLRALLNRSALDDSLMSRVVVQLPRLVLNMKASDLVQFYTILSQAPSRSVASIEAIKPSTISKSGQFSPSDWLLILDSVARIGEASHIEEILEAFVLVNKSPAHYRESTKSVISTVIQRMNNSQLVNLVSIIPRSPAVAVSSELLSLVADSLRSRSISASDASDIYCLFVQMDLHQKSQYECVMKELLKKAIVF